MVYVVGAFETAEERSVRGGNRLNTHNGQKRVRRNVCRHHHNHHHRHITVRVGGRGGGGIHFMHSRRRMTIAIRPSHLYNAGTKHVGVSPTRQTPRAPSAKRLNAFGESQEG